MKKSKSVKFLFLSIVLFAVSVVASFFLLFSGGEKRESVFVPDFVGKRLADIPLQTEFEIKSRGVYSEAPEGEIISQSPYAGAERKLASGDQCKIELWVSLGKKSNTVPDLRGYHYTSAAGILREMGVTVRVVSVFDIEAEHDTVLKTSPDIGSELHDGDRVTLFIARDRVKGSVTVGNYVGLKREDAIARLLMDGLNLGEIQIASSAKKDGRVTEQSIKEGSLVPYGTEIDLVVNEENKSEDVHPFGRH